MNSDTLIFAAVFMVAIVGLCGGVTMFALHRVSSASSALWHRRRTAHHPLGRHAAPHRAFKNVL